MESARLRAIIASARSGNADDFGLLLELYGPRLYGYFFRATGSHHDAEDLLSEITLRLVRQLKIYREQGRFEPWLFRIAANMVRDYIRRQRSHPAETSISGEDDFGTHLADKLPAEVEAAWADMEAAEASVKLNAALGRLDPTVRQMILLRHFGEMSFKEIAELFKCPLGTVLAKVHRGLKKLRELMGESDEH